MHVEEALWTCAEALDRPVPDRATLRGRWSGRHRRRPRLAPPVAVEVDEAAARRSLRDADRPARARARRRASPPPSRTPTSTSRVARPAAGGPRLLALGELEALRDDLAERLREARAALEERGAREERGRVLLERMLLEPAQAQVRARCTAPTSAQGGCGAWQVRPRLGLIGMLAGWWHVKLSSGCPLAT